MESLDGGRVCAHHPRPEHRAAGRRLRRGVRPVPIRHSSWGRSPRRIGSRIRIGISALTRWWADAAASTSSRSVSVAGCTQASYLGALVERAAYAHGRHRRHGHCPI